MNPAEAAEGGGSAPALREGSQRKGGRPRKSSAERRTTKYTVAVNEAERSTIEEAASAAGLAAAVYLREVGVGSRMSKRADDVLYHRLSRIGVRLQHIARHVEGEERAALEALLQEVIDVRATL